MHTLWQDLRYAARQLARAPGFTAAAVLTLALGIGANASIFSAVNGMLLAPLPYPDSHQLVQLHATNLAQGWGDVSVNPVDVRDWAAQSRLFEGMALYKGRNFNLSGQGEPLRVPAAELGANFLPLLRVQPQLGRLFRNEEDTPGNNRVALLSHGLWQRSFAGDPAVVGREIQLDAEPYTIIGVLPADFTFFFDPVDVLTPIAVDFTTVKRGPHFLSAIGRLKPGVTVKQAQAELDTVAAQLQKAYPDTHTGWGAHALLLYNEIFDEILRLILSVMMLGVTFVLLIACANVANLLLARAATREREVAIRAALGAGRWRLIRLLLTESLLLAVVGGAAGLLLAQWGIDILATMPPSDAPRGDAIRLDSIVVLYTAGLSVLTGVIFGLIPAWQASRPDLNHALKEGARGSAGARHRLLKSLVVSEVAMALVLLVVAGLMVRSFRMFIEADPGFNTSHLLTARLALPEAKYPENHQQAAFYQSVLARLQELPGVQSAAAVTTIPLGGSNSWVSLSVEGRDIRPEEDTQYVGNMIVSPDYFRTLGIPQLAGRDFAPADDAKAPNVVVVNESLARRYWQPPQDALGKRVKIGALDSTNPWMTVIGVVGDVRHRGVDNPVRLEMYRVHAQAPTNQMFLLARVEGDPLALATPLREQVLAVDPDQPLFAVQSMQKILDDRLAGPRAGAQIFGFLAVVALALASVGIYGVISYAVSERTHEFGVRMALGAAPGDIFRLTLRQAMVPVGLGLLLGAAGALAGTRALSSLLFGVSPSDPATLLAMTAGLAAVAALASYLPARRATRVDPMTALRYE